MNGILELQITDHLPEFILIKKVKYTCHKGLEKLTYRRYTKQIDKTLYLTELENNLNSYLKIPADGNQLDLMFKNFISDLKATIDKHAPLQKISRKKRKLLSKPWITKGILESIKKKQKMHKTFYRKGNDFEKQIYKKYANLLTRVKSLSKRLYFQFKFHKNRNNLQQSWNTIREWITPIFQKVKSTISILKTTSGDIIDPNGIVNEFNNSFVNIGTEIASSHQTNCNSTISTEYFKNILPSSIFL